VAEQTRENLAKMDRQADDVRRRREYRKAHGIPETTGMAAWLGVGTVEERERVEEERRRVEEELERERETARAKGEEERPRRKVFFGIWGW
jgi:hypothetical protein